jgi:hypothetical protein
LVLVEPEPVAEAATATGLDDHGEVAVDDDVSRPEL